MQITGLSGEGDEGLDHDRLAYLRDMTSRVRFSILERYEAGLVKIWIKISTSDPVFLARVSDGLTAFPVVTVFPGRASTANTITSC